MKAGVEKCMGLQLELLGGDIMPSWLKCL